MDFSSDDEFLFGMDQEQHNIWNAVLGSCVHFHIGPILEDLHKEDEWERTALPCRFALDVLCDKSCPQHWCVIARTANIQ